MGAKGHLIPPSPEHGRGLAYNGHVETLAPGTSLLFPTSPERLAMP